MALQSVRGNMRLVNCIVCGVEFRGRNSRACICSQACCDERRREQTRGYSRANAKLRREQERRRYAANRENRCERLRRRRETHREQVRERDRRWCKANRERLLERRRHRYAANPEKHRKRALRYAETHREQVRERDRHRYAANPELWRERAMHQRMRTTAALQVFRKLIAPCSWKDRHIARNILQQLTGEQSHDNATS